MKLALTLNAEAVEADVEESALLLDVLRDTFGLTGAKRSCDVQVCGACTVLVDRTPVSSCCYLAHDAHGKSVLTIEGLAADPRFAEISRAFARRNAFQCGYCAPGFLMTLAAALDDRSLRSAEDVRREFAGNLCRCTGYRAIVEAIHELAGLAAP